MQIIIDTTNDLSSLDLDVLRALTGQSSPAISAPKAEEPKKAEAKTAKAAPKAAPDPEPEEDVTPDEVSLDDAIALATRLVSNGEAPRVKEALTSLGMKRVGELKGDQIATFVAALS